MIEPIFFLIVIVIIETILSALWNENYFRHGIKIYSKVYSLEKIAQNQLDESVLNEAFKKYNSPSLVFKQIGINEFAFREKLFQFTFLTYTPIMHGKIRINENNNSINVVGYLNWWILAFILTGFVSFFGDFAVLPFLFLLLGVIYIIQKGKYDKVGQFSFEWNSRDWKD